MPAVPPTPPPEASPPLHPGEPGAARVRLHAQLPPGTRLKVKLQLLDANGDPLQGNDLTLREGHPQAEWNSLPTTSPRPYVGLWLALALALYLLVRLVALADYPIYFFTDEAAQTLLAADLIRDGFYSPDREFLPTYFKNVYQYNLGVSVYLQVLPLYLLGKSVEVTRGVNVLVSLVAALACGLAFRKIFNNRYPWIAVLVLSATPAWFLHSRTAFETSLAVSFYAGFLYCYFLYRSGQTRALYAAVIFAALGFYSYSPAQMVLAVSAVLLALSDWRYHWQQRRLLLRVLLLGLALTLPYIRFQIAHPDETLNHLKQIGAYWIQPISLWEKLGKYAVQYLQGLNPLYWYADPGHLDLERHSMDGYGHLLRLSLPFGLWGTWLALKNWRNWAYRTLLIAALAAPSGAALVELGITRALFMVIPAALLTSLGVSSLLEWFVRRMRFPRKAVVLAFGLLLGGFNIFLLGDALLRGPTWSTQYTLSGMQYGARQVFGAAQEYIAVHPGTRIVLSPTWANGTDMLARFFLPEDAPVELSSLESYVTEYHPIDEHMVFILPPEELQRAMESKKFSIITPLAILPYPNGHAGFTFVNLRYVDDIQTVFKREEAERRAVLTETLSIGGEKALVRFSRLDMGQISDVFDGNPNTMVRGMAANPLHLQMEWYNPRTMNGMVIRVGSTATTIDVKLFLAGEEEPRLLNYKLEESSVLRNFEINFTERMLIRQIQLQIKNTNDPEPSHVHVWEVSFR